MTRPWGSSRWRTTTGNDAADHRQAAELGAHRLLEPLAAAFDVPLTGGARPT